MAVKSWPSNILLPAPIHVLIWRQFPVLNGRSVPANGDRSTDRTNLWPQVAVRRRPRPHEMGRRQTRASAPAEAAGVI
jgi:hypothetical protein